MHANRRFLAVIASLSIAAPVAAKTQDLRRAVDAFPSLNASQTRKVRSLLENSSPAIAELNLSRTKLRERRQALWTSIDASLRSILTDDQWRSLQKNRDLFRQDVRLSDSQREALKTVEARLRPDAQALGKDIRALNERWESLWAAVEADARKTLTPEQQKPFDDYVETLKRQEAAESIRAYMTALGEAPGTAAKKKRMEKVAAARTAWANPWAEAWKAKDVEKFANLLTPEFRGSGWSPGKEVRRDHVAVERTMGADGSLARAEVLTSLSDLFAQYADIEDADVTLFGEDEKGFAGRVSLRGVSASTGYRMEATASVRVKTQGAKISQIEVFAGKILHAAKKTLFKDATEAAGLDKIPTYVRWEAIRRGGYALAANDYDQDGDIDLYVGTGKDGILLNNDGKGRFSDATAAAGLDKDALVKSAVFADFNNDGKTDLLLVRFQYSPDRQVVLYEGLDGGTFRKAEKFDFSDFGNYSEHSSYPMPMAVGDFNGDRSLDMYIGFPGKLDFTTLRVEQQLMEGAFAGRPQGLFINRGDFRFDDMTDYALYKHNRVEREMGLRHLYPHSSIATDFDQDGDSDILVIDDRENPTPLLRNNGDGTFTQIAQDIGLKISGWGMSAAMGDADKNGWRDLYMTNVHFAANYALENETGWLFGEKTQDHRAVGNRFYRNINGKFVDATDEAGLRFAGEAPGGAEFLDFDNDGDEDLYVVNGLWSGPNRESLAELFLAAHDGEWRLWMADVTGLLGLKALETPVDTPLNLAAVYDINDGGRMVMKMLQNYLDDKGEPVYAMGGRQRNRLFRNNGDGTFTDIAYLAGVDSIYDGYIAVTADLNKDGALDLILRNADPGTKQYTFPTVQVFENHAAGENKHVSLKLRGVDGNLDAVGAKLTLKRSNGEILYREIVANNGAGQGELLAHFGIGKDVAADRLDVLWPSGRAQTFHDVRPGAYSLREGGKLSDKPETKTTKAWRR